MSYSDDILALSPILYYQTDESSGTLADSGSEGVTLAPIGTLAYQAENILNQSGAIDFAGGGNGFDATAGPLTLDTGSIPMWVRWPLTHSAVEALIHLGDNAQGDRQGVVLYWNPTGGNLFAQYWDGSSYRTADFIYTPTYGDKDFIVVTWSGSPAVFDLYVDGLHSEQVTGINSVHNPIGTHRVRLGCNKSTGDAASADFGGSLSHVSFHDTVLTDVTIASLYAAGTSINVPQITEQPQDVIAKPGEDAVYSVVASSSAGLLTYQWYETTAGIIVDATTDQITVVGVSQLDDGKGYYVVVTDDNDSVTSRTALLTVEQVFEIDSVGQSQGADRVQPVYIGDYPDTFPCPTWNYSQLGDAFIQRTEFDCGWTRQRRRWSELYYTVSMNFTMGTEMFHEWTQWVETYGRQWFYMDLDESGTGIAPQETRFVSDISMQYRTHDTVSVGITAEFRYG